MYIDMCVLYMFVLYTYFVVLDQMVVPWHAHCMSSGNWLLQFCCVSQTMNPVSNFWPFCTSKSSKIESKKCSLNKSLQPLSTKLRFWKFWLGSMGWIPGIWIGVRKPLLKSRILRLWDVYMALPVESRNLGQVLHFCLVSGRLDLRIYSI